MTAVSADTRDLKKLKVALSVLDKQSKRAVGRSLSAAVKPVRDEFKVQALGGAIPRRGGMAAQMAKSRFVVLKKLGGSRPTLSIRVRKNRRGHLAVINEGLLRHPVHGRPSLTRKQWRWVDQRIPAVGIWDRTLERSVPDIEEQLREAVRDAVKATIRAGS